MSVGAVNKQTGERIPTAGMPAVDSVLSGISTNPVQNKVVKEALDEKANTDMVAADFNAGSSYAAGNYCVQDGKLYKFKNNHTGAWSAADVDEVKITGELSALRSGLNDLIPTSISVSDVLACWKYKLANNFNFVMFVFEKNIQDSDIINGHTIISGLPHARIDIYTTVGTDKGVTIPVIVTTTGNLVVYYPSGSYSGTHRIDATICYYAVD